MKYTFISRDPFARQDFIRRKVSSPNTTCDNCGCFPRRGGFFQYGYLKDGIITRPVFFEKNFCSVGCYRDYVK